MKNVAGYAMCFAGGNMIVHGFLLSGIAFWIAGLAHLLKKETNNA